MTIMEKQNCGVRKGSIGSLLFIIYINDLCQASDMLESIMFADDTNLFYLSNDIKTLFLNTKISNLRKFLTKPHLHFFIGFRI